MSYQKLKDYEKLVGAYRELYEKDVFDYPKGVTITSDIISLSKDLEAHYENKTKSSDSYYSPLMAAIKIFFKSQRCIIEVSNRLFKMEVNDSLFGFVNKASPNKVQIGNRVLNISSVDENQKIKQVFLDALEHIKACLPELEGAKKRVSEARDRDLTSVLGGGESLLNAKICFFNSIIAILEKNFEKSIQNLEESIKFIESAIKYIKINLDTPGEVENAKKTEAYLNLLIKNYKNSIKTLKELI
ncbi:MAG: hypothetical protein ACUVXA_14765 [Candidatus Jordarchaeum sp.]|uniref:hypothetical protein n=1 Tax=Candidatus Jordarchaeum sp. TaxID=2823881 RepID=UPI00404B5186